MDQCRRSHIPCGWLALHCSDFVFCCWCLVSVCWMNLLDAVGQTTVNRLIVAGSFNRCIIFVLYSTILGGALAEFGREYSTGNCTTDPFAIVALHHLLQKAFVVYCCSISKSASTTYRYDRKGFYRQKYPTVVQLA